MSTLEGRVGRVPMKTPRDHVLRELIRRPLDPAVLQPQLHPFVVGSHDDLTRSLMWLSAPSRSSSRRRARFEA